MLDEAQIQRYSRQILLRAVGGAGQERLLALRVGWDGRGAAAAVAVAYLAAGGSGVEADAGAPSGFLSGDPSPVRQVLGELNPDALAEGPRTVQLAEAPFSAGPEGTPRLRLGAEEGRAVVILAPADGCPGCLEQACSGLLPVPSAQATAAGALAALVLQRLALGLGSAGGGWTISSPGAIEARASAPCPRCR